MNHTPACLLTLLICALLPTVAQASCKKPADLEEVVRCTAYSSSYKFTENFRQIREWVLLSKSYCSQPDRHVLFDVHGRFLGWFTDPQGDDQKATQAKIDQQRLRYYRQGKVPYYIPGSKNRSGYPFTFSCDRKETDIHAGLARYKGRLPDSRLSGEWNGVQLSNATLEETFAAVYKKRNYKARGLSGNDVSWLIGILLIESSGKREAHSSVGAQGVMQIMPSVLRRDCGVPRSKYRHRIAQVDCAMKLMLTNKKYLAPYFNRTFGHLPEHKKEDLFDRLLVQAYHGGLGNVRKIIDAEEKTTGKAARYFAKHHKSYSAEEIATALVFHNFARLPLRMASIRYVTDVGIARDLALGRLR
jgi:hypothetical protein